MPLLTVTGLDKHYGADQVLNGLSFQMERGESIALVGPNGSGKSTLLRIMAGLDGADAGQVSLARNALVSHLSQHVEFPFGVTLWEAMLEPFKPAIEAQERMREIESELAGGDVSGSLNETYRALSAVAEHGGYDFESRIERVLTGLELLRRDWNRPVSLLSGGQKTRANLARSLLEESDLLLLDEPTNHLDIAAIEWLESYLKSQRCAFIVVAHDRYFLETVSRRTLELVGGRVEDYPGSYSTYLDLRAQRRERAQREYDRQQAQITATEDFIRRYGAGQRSKEAKGRQKRLDRMERVERPTEHRAVTLHLDKRRRKGDIALRLEDLVVGYDGCPLVEAPDDLTVRHGARVAIVGPNGSGKTTLARTLTAELPTVRGSVWWPPGSEPAYYAQSTSTVFAPDETVLQAFQSRHVVGEETARTFLGQFLFTGEEVQKSVGELSGGAGSRLALASLLYGHPNVMLLDEPTNHLDISAREALESALQRFGGTLFLVSHDRYFIDRLATEVWSIEEGRIRVYDGDWSDFVERRHLRPAQYSDAESKPTAPAASRSSAYPTQEIDEVEASLFPILSRLTAMSATATVDQLTELTEGCAGLQDRLRELTESLLAKTR